jgi:anti-sigma factor RsiW
MQYQERISAYIDGELPGDESKELEAHMRGCPSCAALLDFYRLVAETESETRAALKIPEQLFKTVSERVSSMPAPAAAPVFSPAPPRARGITARRPASSRTRRKIGIRRLLPVACVIILLFASRLIRENPDNMAPKYVSGSMSSYDLRRAASPSVEAPGAAPEFDVSGELYSDDAEELAPNAAPSSDGAAKDPHLGAGSESSFTSGAAPMPAPEDIPEYAPESAAVETEAELEPEGADTAYAVIRIYGELPDMLLDKSETAFDGVAFSIEVTRAEADALIGELGFDAEFTGVESDIALVIHTP